MEKILAKNSDRGEKMTNIRYGLSLHIICLVGRPAAASPRKLAKVAAAAASARVEVEKVYFLITIYLSISVAQFDFPHSYHQVQAADFSDCCIICVGSTGAGKSSTVGRNRPKGP